MTVRSWQVTLKAQHAWNKQNSIWYHAWYVVPTCMALHAPSLTILLYYAVWFHSKGIRFIQVSCCDICHCFLYLTALSLSSLRSKSTIKRRLISMHSQLVAPYYNFVFSFLLENRILSKLWSLFVLMIILLFHKRFRSNAQRVYEVGGEFSDSESNLFFDLYTPCIPLLYLQNHLARGRQIKSQYICFEIHQWSTSLKYPTIKSTI